MPRLIPYAFLALLIGPSVAGAADGKAIFIARKCNRCHTVDAAEIAQLPKKLGEPAEEGEDEAKKPTDLSKVGAKHDATWIRGWVLRETEVEGKKHKMKLKGTEEEIAAVTEWLGSLR